MRKAAITRAPTLSFAEMDSMRAMYGLSVQELGAVLPKPFSRSSYWRWLRQETAACVVVEIALQAVEQAIAEQEREIIEALPESVESMPLIRIKRWRDGEQRQEHLASFGSRGANDRRLPFDAYCVAIMRFKTAIAARGFKAVIEFIDIDNLGPYGPSLGIFVPDPILPEANDAPGFTPRKRRQPDV